MIASDGPRLLFNGNAARVAVSLLATSFVLSCDAEDDPRESQPDTFVEAQDTGGVTPDTRPSDAGSDVSIDAAPDSAVDVLDDTPLDVAVDSASDAIDTSVDSGVDAVVDTGPPATVSATKPLDGRVGVGTMTNVTVTFSIAMQPATVTVQPTSGACSGSLQLLVGPAFTSCVGGTIATSDGRTFTFNPAGALGTELHYKVQVSSAALSVGGRALTPYAMTTGFMTQRFGPDAKVLFLTYVTGFMGGLAGADALCNGRVTPLPVGIASSKAMLTGPTRQACSVTNCGAGNVQKDWVLNAARHYVREDGAYVFLTDVHGIFIAYPGANAMGSGVPFYDGLGSDWTSRTPNCSDWTTTTGVGALGLDVTLDVSWLANGVAGCTVSRPIVCAEQ